MRKISLLLLTMLIFAAALTAVPKPSLGSVGNILIDAIEPPSPAISVQAGGDVKLYFGKVDFSGGQVTLYFSRNGGSALDVVNDKAYGPTFLVAKIRDTNIDTTTYPGYSVGFDWINGSIPKQYAGGQWFIKAYDGQTAAVAVTDRPITVTCKLEVTPTWGPGQAAITLKGYGFTPASQVSGNHVNLSYYRTWASPIGYVTFATFITIDENGQFTYSMNAPDAGKVISDPGNQSRDATTVTFRAVEKPGYTTVDFTEYHRGLIQVGAQKQKYLTYLFGNTTDFCALGVNVKVKGDLTIVGNYFHPGELRILWDGTTVVATTSANGTGYFKVTIQIPITKIGCHKIVIDDTKIKFHFCVYVIPTVVLTPDEGVPCQNVQVTAEGFGFTASTADKKYHVNVTWSYIDVKEGSTMELATKLLVDTNGYWTFTFTLPHAHGGEQTVSAVENDTAGTSASAIFTVLPGVKVTPSTFSNDGETIVEFTGCGLKYDVFYNLLIDEKDFYACDSSGWTVYFMDSGKGDFILKMLAAGFDETPKLHRVCLYEVEDEYILPKLVAYTTFTVTSELNKPVLDRLTEVESNLTIQLSDLSTQLSDVESNLTIQLTSVSTYAQNAASSAASAATNALAAKTAADSAASAASSANTNALAAKTAADSAASNASAAKTAADSAASNASGALTAIYAAIVLSLIAALASIVAVITLQRKVA